MHLMPPHSFFRMRFMERVIVALALVLLGYMILSKHGALKNPFRDGTRFIFSLPPSFPYPTPSPSLHTYLFSPSIDGKHNATDYQDLFSRQRYNLDLLPENRKDVTDVMLASDARTLGGLVTVVNSILSHTTSPVYFHLLTVPEEVDHLQEWLLAYRPNIVMEIIAFKKDLSKRLKIRGNTRKVLSSPLNFARYWIPVLVPDITGRLIYLDDDILVLGDIHQMRDQPISPDHILTASADNKNTMNNFFNFSSPSIKALNIQPDEHAFNAGVFVCKVDAWRKENITDKLVYWMERNTVESIYGDGIAGGASQPPMLIALHGR
eukprot:Ihof_evm1s223 gene=Ihof_evmTU1s223